MRAGRERGREEGKVKTDKDENVQLAVVAWQLGLSREGKGMRDICLFDIS